MNMLRNFVKLDILTAMAAIESRRTVIQLFIFFGIALAFGIFMQTLTPTIVISVQVAFLALHLPFRGEFRNMNALYVLLNVSAKNVILGRYIYVFMALASGAVLCLLVIAIGFIAERALGIGIGALSSLYFIATFIVMQLVAQAAYLPVLFMHGQGKLSAFNFLPQVVTVLGAFVVMRALQTEGGAYLLSAFLAEPRLVRMAAIAVPFVIFLGIYVSYRISLMLYSKREF